MSIKVLKPTFPYFIALLIVNALFYLMGYQAHNIVPYIEGGVVTIFATIPFTIAFFIGDFTFKLQ